MNWQHLLQALQYGSHYGLGFDTLLFAGLFGLLLMLFSLCGRMHVARLVLLLTFSLYFYYKASGWFVLLLCATAAADWLIALGIASAQRQGYKTTLLWLSVLLNVGLLCYFKYTGFFIATLNDWLPVTQPLALPSILLPVGISFYTFKTLSYVLDVYNDETAPERNYFYYLAYLSFFGNILAGPITRAGQLLPQLRAPYGLTRQQLARAVGLICLALVMKNVVADYIGANYVKRVLLTPGVYSGLENLLALYAYAIYLFCDFAAYTNLVLGLALLLGYEMAGNFNEPFKARGLSDFWRRWHISLSTWFNDYVYLPLSFGWRRWGRLGTVLAVLLTFFLSGLWHGPAWTYVLWGLSHGLVIAYELTTVRWRQSLAQRMPGWLSRGTTWLLTFHFLLASYALFAAKDLAGTASIFSRIAMGVDLSLLPQWLASYAPVAWALLLGYVLHFMPTQWKQWVATKFENLPWPLLALALALTVLATYQLRSATSLPFVYLQF